MKLIEWDVGRVRWSWSVGMRLAQQGEPGGIDVESTVQV